VKSLALLLAVCLKRMREQSNSPGVVVVAAGVVVVAAGVVVVAAGVVVVAAGVVVVAAGVVVVAAGVVVVAAGVVVVAAVARDIQSCASQNVTLPIHELKQVVYLSSGIIKHLLTRSDSSSTWHAMWSRLLAACLSATESLKEARQSTVTSSYNPQLTDSHLALIVA
jgi:hypothetical protein